VGYEQAGPASSIDTGDVDGDRRTDIVTAEFSTDGKLSVFIGAVEDAAPFDCDADGVLDDCAIESDPSLDADGDGLVDACARVDASRDCDGDGTSDADEIASGDASDCNANEIPDECELAVSALVLPTVHRVPHSRRAERVAAGDFNADDITDFAVLDGDRQSLEVILGRGGETYDVPVAYAAGSAPVFLAALDLDGDGVIDLAFSDLSRQELSIYRGVGDGTFAAATPIAIGGQVFDAVFADFDGDGTIDVAAAEGGFTPAQRVTIAIGRESGGFEVLSRIALRDNPRRIVSGDFDGDGDADLATVNRADVSILLGGGGSNFHEPRHVRGAALNYELSVIDVDGDAFDDLIAWPANDSTPDAVVLRSLGDGDFVPVESFAAPTTILRSAAGDFDQDGIDDIAALSFADEVSVWRGLGGGRFARRLRRATGSGAVDFRLEDLDNDGMKDIVVANRWSGALDVFDGRGDGAFGGIPSIDTVRERVAAGSLRTVVVDLDGDRLPEVVSSSENGRALVVRRNLGGLVFAAAKEIGLGEDLAETQIVAGDVQGENGTVLFGRLTSGESTFVRLRVAGTDGPVTRHGLVEIETGNTELVRFIAADIDADGRSDLIAPNGLSKVYVVRSESDDTLAEPLAFEAGDEPIDTVVADFTGDRLPDLVVLNLDSEDIHVFEGTGATDYFRLASRFPTGSEDASFRPFRGAAHDLDGDASLDLVVLVYGQDEVRLFRGQGDGTFGESLRFAVGRDPSAMLLADFDGDGRGEIVTADRAARTLSFVVANAAIDFAPAVSIAAGSPLDIVASDLDGDGREDILVVSEDPNDGFRGYFVVPNLSVRRDPDCNANSVPDSCDAVSRPGTDLNGNTVPDECESDCNSNARPDDYDIAQGSSDDCDANTVPDECDLASGETVDIDGDGTLDVCEPDCDGNGKPDVFDIMSGSVADCDQNGVPDLCQIAADIDLDVDGDDVLDACEPDCNGNGFPDDLDIAATIEEDKNQNGVPDSCEGGAQRPGDCTQDGIIDIADAICLLGALFLGTPERLPCGDGTRRHAANLLLLDWQGDGQLDISDGVAELSYLFLGGPAHSGWSGGVAECTSIADCPGFVGCR
jgi:hypothetical protein